jgi:hypothetical protein
MEAVDEVTERAKYAVVDEVTESAKQAAVVSRLSPAHA